MEEENQKKTKAKQISIAVVVCVAIVGCLAGISIGIYNAYYGNKPEVIQTLAENETEKDEEIEVEIKDETDENAEEENAEENEQSPEEVKELSEEEKQKQEEERKRREEEQKKKREDEQKVASEGYPYWIKVNYTANTVTVYGKDADGNYTVPVRAMICSTGQSTPTSGVYQTPQKARWGLLIGPSWGQYCTRIVGQILFHSVPYDRQSEDSLHTVYYDRLGITTSLGCIRLTVADAKWLYDNCPLGTSVEFYSSSDPGPLGKPTAMKISGYGEPLNRWDPTDPNPNNPWHAYFSQNGEQENNQEEDNNNKQEEKQDNKQEEKQEKEQKEEQKNESEPQKEPEVEKVKVPDVVGKSKEDAEKMLKDFKVTINKISDTTKSNKVIVEQKIKAGTEVEKGTTIVIVYNEYVEENEGTININVKSITGYKEEAETDQTDEKEEGENNVVTAKKIQVQVTANDKIIYTKEVLENTEVLPVTVKGNGTVKIKVTVGNIIRNTQINLDKKNQVVSVK